MAEIRTIVAPQSHMPSSPLKITQLDARRDDFRAALAELRNRLSPQGNVVSEAGRQKTIAVFGEPLSPQQVVERICADVRSHGLPAVLDYGKRLDGADLSAGALRVPAAELARAHSAARPQLLATIRRIRKNIQSFQQAILEHDVRLVKPHGGYLRQR
ncbi:MAG TPA: histidinol dehydrogenase, partial [Pirellulales bacterium]|nr:histidinol dehydrogenase [Pirellulales bacterium]